MFENPPQNNEGSIEKKIEILHKYLESADNEAIIECMERNREKAIELGRGNHAVVYTVDHEILGSLCVKEMIDNPEITANHPEDEFEIQEFLKAKNISTPSLIAQIFDKKLNKNYIMMERIFGNSVRDIIKGRLPLPEKFNLELFNKKLEKAIASMHENGVLHRDLHAGNVMIDENGDPVVIDFGMSSYSSPNTDNAYEKEILKKGKDGKYQRVIDKGLDDRQQVLNLGNELARYIRENGRPLQD